jgi:hypothetical protein
VCGCPRFFTAVSNNEKRIRNVSVWATHLFDEKRLW